MGGFGRWQSCGRPSSLEGALRAQEKAGGGSGEKAGADGGRDVGFGVLGLRRSGGEEVEGNACGKGDASGDEEDGAGGGDGFEGAGGIGACLIADCGIGSADGLASGLP